VAAFAHQFAGLIGSFRSHNLILWALLLAVWSPKCQMKLWANIQPIAYPMDPASARVTVCSY
jgi:hypothetical protein